MKNWTIPLSKLTWRALCKPRLVILYLLLVGLFYWLFAVRPYLCIEGARVSAPFLEIRTDQTGRLTFAPHEEGAWIKQGQVLFSLSTEEEKKQQKQMLASVESLQGRLAYYLAGVEKATEDYIAARRDVDLQRALEESAEQILSALQQQQVLANECKQQLASAQENLEQANQFAMKKSLVAPFSGVIVHRQKREGDLLAYGDIVYSLCDPSQVWVDAVVPEKEIGNISIGQSARVQLVEATHREWQGMISWISPVAQPSNEGVRVRISLNKKEGDLLIPNLRANVKIKIR
jgi:HlyD family secretion protein